MFYTLHKTDNGAIVSAKKGDRIVIALEEQPGQVTKWLWVANPSLSLVDESKKTEDFNVEVRIFRFAINNAGTDITFNLENPYTDDTPVDTFKFSIEVK